MIWTKLKGWLSKRKYKLIISLVSLLYPTRFCYMPPCGEGMVCTQAFECETKLLIQMFKIYPVGTLIDVIISYLLTYFIISLIFYSFKNKEKIKKYPKKVIIGGIIGLVIGLLPYLVIWDIVEELEFLAILLLPLSVISKNMLFIIFSTPIFYAILGALIGHIIAKRKKK